MDSARHGYIMNDAEIEGNILDIFQDVAKKIEDWYQKGEINQEDRYWMYSAIASKLEQRASEL